MNVSARRAMVVSASLTLAGLSPAALSAAAGSAAGLDDKQAPPAPATATPAIDLKAPLPTDPRLVTGELDNGMRYIVVRHANPPGRANMFIHVSSGSLNETEKQRGIAHYLEHMAFNGSENFPPGKVVDFFQSMGLTFGVHQNAFTSFDQTAYILSFPDVKPETLERGMRFFADVAGRLLLTQAEIEEERQIIMEEKRTRLGAQQRVQEAILARIAPGSTIGRRLPIGVEETIMGVQREDFLDYYSRWYVPSNMTVIVVADTDPAGVVEQIVESFSGGQKKPRPADLDPGVTPYTSTGAIVAHDPELTQAEIGINRIDPPTPPITTYAGLRDELVERLGTSAFNRRMGRKLAQGGVPFLTASASTSSLFNALRWSEVAASGEPGQWRDMLAVLGTELQRARLHGFSAREIDDVKSALIADAEQSVERESTLRGDVLTRQINSAVAVGDTIMSARQELDALKALLPTISPSEASQRFATQYDTRNVMFVATLPSGVSGGVPSEAELAELGAKALDVKPEKEAEAARADALLKDKPAPGKVVEAVTHEASGVASAWLSNGVRVHHRFMDIEKDRVTVTITLAAGAIQEDDKTRGVSQAAGLAFARPATSTLSSTDIRDLMTGKKVRVGGGAGLDTMALTIAGSPGELEPGFQLAHLLLTDPVIEPAALEQWKTAELQSIAARDKDPQAAFAAARARTVYPSLDVRTQPLTAAQVKAITPEAAREFLRRAVAASPIEVSVVGDIPREQAMTLVSAYVGSIPGRDRIGDSTLDALREIPRSKGPTITDVAMATQTPLAVVATGFYGPDLSDTPARRRMQLATQILNTRLMKVIREERQLGYSPGCGVSPGREFPGYGTFTAISPTAPEKVEQLIAGFDEVVSAFAQHGPTDEEVAVAKKQIANTLDDQMKSPAFWTSQLSQLNYRDLSLDDIMNAQADYQTFTPDSIRETFARFATPENSMRVVVRPAEGEAKP
jgi:zinc protease